MKKYLLDEMTKGWFVGSFNPSVLKTNDVEVGVKKYNAGAFEEEHYHKIATEITLILSGRVKMFEKIFATGDIIKISPGESTSFEALEDTITVVVKHPGASNDKYLGKGIVDDESKN
jgi:quercetin dioxygenase-like cupin family protein